MQKDINSNGLVVAISADSMGRGSDELGKILVKAFIYSLTELATPPDALVFFNSGARLATNESNTIEDLRSLEEKGTKLLICGTCVNYYGFKDKLAVGSVSNMSEIAQTMANAANVINI